jgi:hypothetical protein
MSYDINSFAFVAESLVSAIKPLFTTFSINPAIYPHTIYHKPPDYSMYFLKTLHFKAIAI